jgi:hypothetical protein
VTRGVREHSNFTDGRTGRSHGGPSHTSGEHQHPMSSIACYKRREITDVPILADSIPTSPTSPESSPSGASANAATTSLVSENHWSHTFDFEIILGVEGLPDFLSFLAPPGGLPIKRPGRLLSLRGRSAACQAIGMVGAVSAPTVSSTVLFSSLAEPYGYAGFRHVHCSPGFSFEGWAGRAIQPYLTVTV